MDLVRLIVAGHHMHDQVHPEPERQFALLRATRTAADRKQRRALG